MGRRPENGRGDFPQFIPFSLSMHSKFGVSMFVQVYTVLYNNKYSPSISVLEAWIKGEVGTDLAL